MYNGELFGVPEEVVAKMLERQVEQGNPKSVAVFEKEIIANKDGGGFNWDDTEEGLDFWVRVLMENNFDFFFNVYPKSDI